MLRGDDRDRLVGWVTPKGLLVGEGSGGWERVSKVLAVGGVACWERGVIRGAQHSPKRFRASMLGGESRNGGQAGTLRLRDAPTTAPRSPQLASGGAGS